MKLEGQELVRAKTILLIVNDLLSNGLDTDVLKRAWERLEQAGMKAPAKRKSTEDLLLMLCFGLWTTGSRLIMNDPEILGEVLIKMDMREALLHAIQNIDGFQCLAVNTNTFEGRAVESAMQDLEMDLRALKYMNDHYETEEEDDD